MNQVCKQEGKNSARLCQSLHIGTKKAFGAWKLIWLDADNKVCMKNISKKTARALMDTGMPYEG